MDDTKPNVDAPISVGYKDFTDYGFSHWLDSIKKGEQCKTLCLLGRPGIGKSATAYVIAKRMTDYVRQNPAVIFGVGSLKEAAELLNKERTERLTRQFMHKAIVDQGVEATTESVQNTVDLMLKLVDPITEDHIRATCRLLDFSSMLPEDLNGLPFREGNETKYCPQRWVHELTGKYAFGVVVQDDLPAAPPAMHTAGRQMALERRIHDHRFGPGVLIIVTGNRREDKASAKTLPSHFRNSVTFLSIEPDLDEWKKWYGQQTNLDRIVPAFLTWKPELLAQTPSDADPMGAFATPRQWANVGRQFAGAEAASKMGDVLHAVMAGIVGKPVATTFCGFVEINSQLPDPEKVFNSPLKMLPNPEDTLATPDKKIAMVCALGDIASRRWKQTKGTERGDVPVKLMRALAHVCAGSGEYAATGVQTFLDAGGNLTAIAKVARDFRKDAVIGPLLDHVKDALLGGA